ncbi:MAG: hypothetical protein ABW252_15995 [Polyangiales bacterium]
MSLEPTVRDALQLRMRERGVTRVNVELDGEQVTLWLRDGALLERCTCGGEGCEHLHHAASLLDGSAPSTSLGAVELRARGRASVPSGTLASLADALDEVALSVVRAGLAHTDSPSIQRAMAQLLEAQGEHVPLPLGRFVGRLTDALAAADASAVARLLDGALRFAERLRRDDVSPEAVAQRRAWLGPAGGGAPGSRADLSLLELAREWVTGCDRAAIERRYLLDLATGELACEERLRGAPDVSVGPCPRALTVAFAEVEEAARPARLRLLQYTLTLRIGDAQWAQAVALADRELAAVRARCRRDLEAAPALAEPCVWFAPEGPPDGDTHALRDALGEVLPLAGAHGDDQAARVLRALAESDVLAGVFGRLVDGDSGLALHPLSAVVRRGATHALYRLR